MWMPMLKQDITSACTRERDLSSQGYHQTMSNYTFLESHMLSSEKLDPQGIHGFSILGLPS
jgi:hypothetical protein